MSSNADKTKFSIRVDTKLLELCDEYIEKTDTLNRTELIEMALKFYISYLTSKKIEDYLLQSLSSVLTGTVHDSENRIARIIFKMSVELSKLSHIIAYSHNVDENTLQKLHVKCLDEVKRINGTVNFEDVYKYQKHEV
jgi:metal-responsive CopG/Arc/MetJ family transcriptional regulator